MRMLKPAVIALAIAIMGAPALAQVPKTSDGKPDLTGFWTHASLTPLQRAPSNKTLVVSEAEAKRIADGTAVAGIPADDPEFRNATYSDPTKGAPPKGGKDFGVKGYDSFWTAPGSMLANVKGEYRTSHVVDPPNGQLPFKDPALQAKRRAANTERYQTGNAAYEGPEATTLGERCLIFSGLGGPGMMSGLYNNNYEMVLTPTHLMILVEQVHDARIVPIYESAEKARANHKPSAIKPWLGDTVGWWDGDALAMESINVEPKQQDNHSYPISPKAVITERLTRTGEKSIFYEFSVNDPETYTQPWKAELSFYPSEGVYEYACHEGNYGMHGILAGAREKERQRAAVTAKSTKSKTVKGGQ
ncbi:MAG TPA: hypothetical protein PLH23_15685 [Hyphomonadaceae bacterium]|nr:hypothetical protein [Hyphomonadaceae bacterium]HPI49713.1 hypothetical protein [Hyphomonadaceae bacterium]